MAGQVKGIWHISASNSSELAKEGEFITGVLETYMLWLPIGAAIRTGATTFGNAFDSDDCEKAFYEAALHHVLKTFTILCEEYEKESVESLHSHEYPFRLDIETVLADCPNSRDIVGQYGNTPEQIRARPFMNSVGDDIPVVEYRIFIHVLEKTTKLDFGKIFDDIITDNNKLYRAWRDKNKGDESKNESLGAALASYTGSNSRSYARTITPDEKDKLIDSRERWAEVADMLLGLKRLSKPEVLAKLRSRTIPYSSNPLHPLYSLSPCLYFQHPHEFSCLAQQQLANYSSQNGTVWKYPRPDCVIHVNPRDSSVLRFRQKLLPDYQARSLGELLNTTILPQPRLRHEYVRSRVGGSTRNGGVLRRHMVHRDTSSGTADSLFDNLPLSGAEHDQFSREINAENSDVGLDLVGDCSRIGEVMGGSGQADIMAMNNSVPVTDGSGNYELYDIATLAREDFEDANSLLAQSLLNRFDNPNASAFHLLRYRGARLRSQHDEEVSSGEFDREKLREKYVFNQRRLFRDYEDTCMLPTSDISHEGQLINTWYSKQKQENNTWPGQESPLIDERLSTFANIMARRMLRLESVGFVVTAHALINIMFFGELDAYRHYLDLHWYICLTGKHSAGKSFVLDMMHKFRIPQTVAPMGIMTGKAAYVDGNRSDRIFYCEELNPEAFKTKKGGGDDTEEARMKDSMTSQVRVIRAFHREPDGKRSQRVVYSEQIWSASFASNESYDKFSAPIQSRMSCINFVERHRADRHPADLQNVEKNLPAQNRKCRDLFLREMTWEQFLHYHIEKLIGVYAIKDVTLSVLESMQQLFRRYLLNRCGITVETRTLQRSSILARKMVITRACELLYSHPDSEYYKKPFNIYQLMAIEPLLHDDEEIARFALESLSHEIISETRRVCFDAFFELYLRIPRERYVRDQTRNKPENYKGLYMTPETIIDNMDQYSGRIDDKLGTGSNRANTMASIAQGVSNPKGLIASDCFPASYMYAYVRSSLALRRVTQQIAKHTKNKSVSLEPDTIYKHFNHISDNTIEGHLYEWDPETNAPRRINADPVVVDGVIVRGNDVFVHLDLLTDTDPVQEALKYCLSKHLKEERWYVTSRVVNGDNPHLFQLCHVAPYQGKEHSVVDYARQISVPMVYAFSDLVENNVQPDSGLNVLTQHYDDICRMHRAQALFLPEEDGLYGGKCCTAVYDKKSRQLVGDSQGGTRKKRYVLDKQVRYPDGLCNVQSSSSTFRTFVASYAENEEDVFDSMESLSLRRHRSEEEEEEEEEEEAPRGIRVISKRPRLNLII